MRAPLRVVLLLVSVSHAWACSKGEEAAGAKSGAVEWVKIGSFNVFDPISEVHARRTFQNLGIEWRCGKELWRGYTLEVRSVDRDRAIAALIDDEKAGNISVLDGVDSTNSEPKLEVIRRPAAEFLKSDRFAEGTLEGCAIRHPEFTEALKNFPNVESYSARFRSYLDEDNRRRKGVEIQIKLVVDLEKKVAGKGLDFKIYKDGEFIEVSSGGEWWQGGEQSKEELRRRGKARPN